MIDEYREGKVFEETFLSPMISRSCSFHFFLRPKIILKKLNGNPIGIIFSLYNGSRKFISSQLIITSIGFFTPKFKELPYDNDGLMVDKLGLHISNMKDVFPCGWALTEGKGTLAQALYQSKIIVNMVMHNINDYKEKTIDKRDLFNQKNIRDSSNLFNSSRNQYIWSNAITNLTQNQ